MLDHIPYEIFRKIIKSSYTYHPLPSTTSFQFDEVNLPPIKATHVCRSWRTALLSDPTMWTCIVFTHRIKMDLDQLNETLSRSCSVPLRVFFYLYGPHRGVDYRDMISVVSQQMHRCQQLQVIFNSAHVAHLASHCLDKPVPMLQKFYLDISGHKGSLDMLRGIHETLFSGHAPNLEHARLEIFGGLDNLQLSLLKNLSSLHLSLVPGGAVTHCGDMLLDILQSSPCIRMLSIKWHFSYIQPVLSMPNSNRRIPLPHLRDLSLEGGCSVDIADIVLGHLEFSMENIKFDITWIDSHISESTLLLHFLSQRRFTFLSFHNALYMIIDFSETQMDQGFSGSRFRIRRARAQHDLPKFLRTFNLSDIIHMSLVCLKMKSDVLRDILLSLANLQYLCIRHNNQWESPGSESRRIRSSCLRALLPRRRRQRSSPQTRGSSESDTDDSNTDSESSIETWQGQLFPCPSLRTFDLCFSDIEWDGSVRLDKTCLPALIRCSRVREQAGYPFKYIVNCYRCLHLAKDIEVWLQAHEGFPIEVRRAPGSPR